MADHIAELIYEYEATVEYRVEGAEPGVTDARVWLQERRIVAKPIKTRRNTLTCSMKSVI